MTTIQTRITQVEQISGRWFWTVTNELGESCRMRTNNEHEGCWQKIGNREEWKQVDGTCQFSLRGKSISAIRSYLRRQFAS